MFLLLINLIKEGTSNLLLPLLLGWLKEGTLKGRAPTKEGAKTAVSSKDINMEMHDGVLTIQGQSVNEVADNNIQYIYKGIAKRAFEQKFRLEQFVEVKDAKLSDGLLTISLKREIPEERKPKKIPLKVA